MLDTGAREQMCSETTALEKPVEDLACGRKTCIRELLSTQDSGTTFPRLGSALIPPPPSIVWGSLFICSSTSLAGVGTSADFHSLDGTLILGKNGQFLMSVNLG